MNWIMALFGKRKRLKHRCTKHLIQEMSDQKAKVMQETLASLGELVKKKQVA